MTIIFCALQSLCRGESTGAGYLLARAHKGRRQRHWERQRRLLWDGGGSQAAVEGTAG